MQFDRLGRLDCDVTCTACGHNLRGLRVDGVCCECGQPVERSLRASGLAAAEPRWLGRVNASVGCLTVLLPWLWLPLIWPVVLVAGWLATTPDPGEGGRAVWHTLALRITLSALVILPGPVTLQYMDARGTWQVRDLLVPLAVHTVCLWYWIALLLPPLCRRVDRPGLRRIARIQFWIWSSALVLLLGGALLGVLSSSPNMADAAVLLVAVGAIELLGGLALLPIVAIRLWRELELALTLARAQRERPPLNLFVAACRGSAARPPAGSDAGRSAPP